MKLSVAIITFNEENIIGKTIDSIKEISDEIIIVDSHSTDKTVFIAEKKGAKVFIEDWKGYGEQKNSAIEKCNGDWILLLDADEVVSSKLKKEIKITISRKRTKDVYKIKRKSIVFRKKINFGGWQDFVIRLWKKGSVKIQDQEVHEVYEVFPNKSVGCLKNEILHYTYYNIKEYINKLNRYTTESSIEMLKNKKNFPSIFNIYLKTLFRFFKIYLFKFGFLDGYEGYLLAKYSSIYTMTKYTKYRELYYKTIGQDTTLIITTYNWKEALELSIDSVLNQTVLPKEIIIADDGSDNRTKKLIDNFKLNNPHINIIHSWQEDKGFRLSRSRNRAINKASGDYIIIIDGDLVLDRNFVFDHINNREENIFIQGSRVLISEEETKKILEETKKIDSFRFFNKNYKNKMNIIRNKYLSKVFSKVDASLKGIRGCNMSFWKKDLELVNGYEEKVEGWGREDSELAVRLFNNGIKKKRLKNLALTYHMYHKENDRSKLNENDFILKEAIERNKKFAEKGLGQY